ncbi:dihydroorotate oxidase A [Asanoa ferruginea]|uniref:Dihydroorotate dehydrogenase (quinone) n=1 Tax=Asanoa ferruginea TaxID=53367 RepID=A0A3D9ZN12_9ACTN|nr:quinone-dependent dihydroorotate dehydrogenase [Asanoa ferruginea]REF98756.1 dihydroorotate oxidase A [Asanoa ferruginea]GIF49497.1 dihydroorotate dehydrogenase (quinone) [Asanoa ferruginea]
MLFERVVRPALFRIGSGDAEAAHEWTLTRLAGLPPAARRIMALRYARRDPRTVFGVEFPNPVGLAAGVDKNGVALAAWPALGFGFVEVGTVTAHPQPGNPKPRLFRLRGSDAIVNRMGFNNEGAAALAARLAGATGAGNAPPAGSPAGNAPADGAAATAAPPFGVPLGISLGKSKVTPLDEAVDDYLASYKLLRDHGDYFAVNVSSPNTPGLRSLQDRDSIDALLRALVGEKPILVKIAPDLSEAAIAELLEVCLARGAAGVIATNTTLSRSGLAAADAATGAETGGLSGAPLTRRAREVVRFVHNETGGRLPVIGVGGIMSADDASRMFDAGASLVQVYTGFIYHGPALVRQIVAQKGQS